MRDISPNQHGVAGTDCEEVWIVTEESAILLIGPPSLGIFSFSLLRRHIFLLTRYLLQPRCAIRGPQIQRILAHPPTASVTASTTGVIVDLFEGGWLELGAGLPHARVIVARHPAPPADGFLVE